MASLMVSSADLRRSSVSSEEDYNACKPDAIIILPNSGKVVRIAKEPETRTMPSTGRERLESNRKSTVDWSNLPVPKTRFVPETVLSSGNANNSSVARAPVGGSSISRATKYKRWQTLCKKR